MESHNHDEEIKIGIILLAAGSSSRMGQSKQLLLIKGEPLLIKSVKAAIGSHVHKVVVVLGANEEPHRNILKNFEVDIIYNPNWQKGIGNSLKTALKYLITTTPEIEAVILLVCDQPLLKTVNIKNLIHNFIQTKKEIVASSYANTIGVPALFEKKLFPQLLAIDDGHGAKKIIQQFSNAVSTVNFPGGEIDLDTLSDYNTFNSKDN
jgi:molybdenum cofactor cytidylyltransferase